MVYIGGFDKKSPIVYSSVFEFEETYNRSFDIWQYSLHVLRRQSDLNLDLGSA